MTQTKGECAASISLATGDRRRYLIPVTLVLSVAGSGIGQPAPGGEAALAGTDDYELVRYTIDGGGTAFLEGGEYQLLGTIGQPDANAPVVAGDYELTGGFWFSLASGDCNSDGGVNLIDFAALQACLLGPADNSSTALMCECFNSDEAAAVDLRDFAAFQRHYGR